MTKAHKFGSYEEKKQQQSTKDTLKKIFLNEKALIIVLIIIAIFASSFFRMYTSELSVTQDWSRNTFYENIKSNIRTEINKQYPNLPEAQKTSMIHDRFEEIIATQGEQLEPQIKQQAQYFKSKMQDEHNNTYLLAIDPYVWYSMAQNYEEHGQFGDSVVDGKQVFSLRNGREGKTVSFQAPSYAMVVLHKIGKVFNSNFSLQRAAFLLPVFIIALAIIPAFFIGRKIGGNVSGFIAGLIIAINTALLGRTPAGFSDTDAYIIFFPLLVAWLFIEGLSANTLWKRQVLGGATALSLVVFKYFWQNSWHMGTVIFGALGIYLFSTIIREWKTIKQCSKKIIHTNSFLTLRYMICILLGLFVFGFLFGGFSQGLTTLSEPFVKPLGALAVKSVATTDIWPNVLTTVAELNAGSFKQILHSVGGKLFFTIASIGILLTLFLRTEKEKIDVKYIALIGLWFFGLTFAGIMSSRFIALLAAPFAIAFASFFGIIYKKIPQLFSDQKNTIILLKIGVIVFAGLLFIAPLSQAHQVAKSEVPSINDAWHDSLISIKEDNAGQEEKGIITSWWDFGHWFVNIAEQRVTFDGGDQGKRIYWVGKSLMTNSEEENLAILRMLNCGQNLGYERLLEITQEKYLSTQLINTIIYQDKEEAIHTLESFGISPQEANYVVEKTHCSDEDLLDQYYIVSEDMVGKAGVWAHFGGWDFEKAQIYSISRKQKESVAVKELMQTFSINEEKAIQYYYDANALENSQAVDSWISPWPRYLTSKAKTCTQENETITCSIKQTIANQNDVIAVLDSVHVPLSKPEESTLLIVNYNSAGVMLGSQEITPKKITLGDENGYNTYEVAQADFPYEVSVVQGDSWIKAIIAEDEVSDSAFSKLFFFEGVGINNYEMISDRTSFTGDRIIVYKVNLKK